MCEHDVCVLSRQRDAGAVGGRLHHATLQPDHRRGSTQRSVYSQSLLTCSTTTRGQHRLRIEPEFISTDVFFFNQIFFIQNVKKDNVQ